MSCDIFNPAVSEAQFRACATTEQIQIFLWQQLSRLKMSFVDFQKNQLDVNDDFNGRITSNSNSIILVNTTINTINSAMTTLKTDMQQLRTDFNNHRLSVDQTLNLYQTTLNTVTANITALTSDQQALNNRVGVLESQTNLPLLQEIIRTYEQVLANTQAMIDDSLAPINQRITSLDIELSDNYVELDGKINSLSSSVDTRINNQNTAFNEFQARVNATITDNEIWMKANIDRIDAVNDRQDAAIQLNVNNIAKFSNESIARDTALGDKIAQNERESIARDGILQGNIDHLQADIEAQLQVLQQAIADGDNSVKAELNTRIDTLNTHLTDLRESDTRQWDTINNILETNNRITDEQEQLNAGLVSLRAYVDTQDNAIKSLITTNTTNIATNTNTITKIENNIGNKFRFQATFDDVENKTFTIAPYTLKFTTTRNALQVITAQTLVISIANNHVAFYDRSLETTNHIALNSTNPLTINLFALHPASTIEYLADFDTLNVTATMVRPQKFYLFIQPNIRKISFAMDTANLAANFIVTDQPVIS